MQSERMEPPRAEPINQLTGIFLKSVYFLDTALTKSFIAGIFKNRENSLGVLFTGRKGSVYWSYDTFNQLAINFNAITLAVEQHDGRAYFGPAKNILVCRVFGKPYVFLHDDEKKHSLSLNSAEWTQFVNNLPLVYKSLRELFMVEDSIGDFVCNYLSRKDDLLPDTTLSPLLVERLTDELQLYTRWPNNTTTTAVYNEIGSN